MSLTRSTALCLFSAGIAVVVATPTAHAAQPDAPAEAPDLVKSGPVPTEAELRLTLDEAPTHIKLARYDEAIASLESVVDHTVELELLRTAYLLLIKTYVIQGNNYRGRPGQNETARLLYSRAAEVTLECLRRRGLQDTEPELPPHTFPEEMVALFDRIRRDHFGGVRFTSLTPPEASIELNGTSVKAAGTTELPEIHNLPAGSHTVRVEAQGYRPLVEDIHISPGAMLERPIELERARTTMWWVTRGGVVLGLTALGAFLVSSDGPSDQPLPWPPDPPAE